MRAWTILPVLLLMAAGCETGTTETAPDPDAALVGMWQMTEINGAPPPYVEQDTPGNRWEITGGTMRFSSILGGSAFLYCRRITRADYPSPRLEATVDDFGWSVDGDSVTVNFFRPAYLEVNAAELRGGNLVLHRTFEADDRVYTFRRVSETPSNLPGCS